MSIHIEPRFLTHSSATKFYEIVQFHNVDDGKFVVVKRWGAMGRAGEIQVLTYNSMRLAQMSADKFMRDKERRGYRIASSGAGLHGLSTDNLDETELARQLNVHYKPDQAMQVMIALEWKQPLPAVASMFDNDVVVEEPTSEPERGQEWGSW